MGLAFSGSKIQGASVLLEQYVTSAKAAEDTIQRLKAANIPETNTMGFMFACVGRGHNTYNNQRNVEANAFRKIFPNVPLLGFFGNGEIGCDRIIKENYTLSETDAEGLQHSFTTVMSLVHFGWCAQTDALWETRCIIVTVFVSRQTWAQQGLMVV